MKQYRNGALINCKATIMTIATFYIKTKYCSCLGGLRIRYEILIRYILYIGFRFSVYYQLYKLSPSLQLLKSYRVETNQKFYICSKDSGFTSIKVLSVPKATSLLPKRLQYHQRNYNTTNSLIEIPGSWMSNVGYECTQTRST